MNLFKEQGVKDCAAAASQIPVIDFGPYFAGETGTLERLATLVKQPISVDPARRPQRKRYRSLFDRLFSQPKPGFDHRMPAELRQC
jgi:hypothetical protein